GLPVQFNKNSPSRRIKAINSGAKPRKLNGLQAKSILKVDSQRHTLFPFLDGHSPLPGADYLLYFPIFITAQMFIHLGFQITRTDKDGTTLGSRGQPRG
ncbi:MAG: hypothetical protein PHT78_13295, partial [Desulfitobacteriaceae bacterium]|nr:hypothetical protein [Desulfitobacteriaceae bacterium]